MGYCGAPSKGCEICRMRKIKCDRSGTPCNNCIVHKRIDECTYRNQLDLNFRIVAHSTLAAQVKKDQARRRERKHRKLLGEGKKSASAKERSSSTAGADSSDEASVSSSRSSTPEIGANAGASPIEAPPVGPNGVREYKWDYFTVDDWEREEGVRGTSASASVSASTGRGRGSAPAVTRTPSPIQERQQQPQRYMHHQQQQQQQPLLPGTSEFLTAPNWALPSGSQAHAEPATKASVLLMGKHLYPLQTSQLPPASTPLSDSGSSSTPVTYAMHGTPSYQFVTPTTDSQPYYSQSAFADPPTLQQAAQAAPYIQPGPSRHPSQSSVHPAPPMSTAPHSGHGPYQTLPAPSSSSNAIPRTSHLHTLPTHRKPDSLSAGTASPRSQVYTPEPIHTCQGGTGSVADGIEIWGCKACLSAGHYAWHVRDGVTLYPVKNAAGEWGCGQCWAWMERFSQNQQLYAALGL